jgi:two-component system, NtrC family, sensor kinase
MAHEFNNSRGIILGFAEEVRSELPPADHNHRALLIIEEETRRCQKILQELLQLTRPTGPEPAWTNIRETVEKSLALVANRLHKRSTCTRDSMSNSRRFTSTQNNWNRS